MFAAMQGVQQEQLAALWLLLLCGGLQHTLKHGASMWQLLKTSTCRVRKAYRRACLEPWAADA
jgi:hypothetical protein